MSAGDEARRQALAVLRALAGGPSLAGDLLAQPSAQLLQSLEREGLLAHLDAPPDSGLAAAARDAARRAAQRNLFGLATLAAVHRAFARAGVAHLAFKGPVSNALLFGGRARRIYADLDLLVRRDDRERAAAALAGLSFRRPTRGGPFAALARRIHFHAAFAPPPRTELLPVELHWALVDRVNLLRIDLEALFAAAETLSVGGERVPVLDPAAHLLYLCCHLRKHDPLIPWGVRAGRPAEWFCREARGYPLAWLLDLHHSFLIVAERLGPERLTRLAHEWNVVEEVADAVGLLDRVMPSPRRSAAIARLGLAVRPLVAPGAARSRLLAALMENRLGRLAASRGVRLNEAGFFRPIRLLDLPRVFAPSPSRLRAFHRDARSSLPRLYTRHVLTMLRRLLDP